MPTLLQQFQKTRTFRRARKRTREVVQQLRTRANSALTSFVLSRIPLQEQPRDPQGALTSCNICAGTRFGTGPSNRLAITRRLPLCVACRSLERHRVARRIFNQLGEYTAGTRCLQFSADPSLDPSWFTELLVSIWQGENSLDMQAIDVPDGHFQWIYSSHVLNHVPDQAAALRDMLRVVGDRGFVVLSVGGTVFNYATQPSTRQFGSDRQFVLYGTAFADDIQLVLPDVAVLELIAVDPCTASLDSIFLYSRDHQALTEMANLAVADNIHARVFPAPKPRQLAATGS